MCLLADAMAQGAAKIGSGFVDSLVLGSGQFCTNPGLVIAHEGDALNRFRDAAALQGKTATTTLTPGIHRGFFNSKRTRLNLDTAGASGDRRQ